MDRKQRYEPAVVSRLSSLSVLPRLGILFCLLIFATQLAIPVAQLWHVAAEHVPEITLHDQRQSDPSNTLSIPFESHRDHESNDGLYCPECQTFVYTQDVIAVHTQIVTAFEPSIHHLSVTPFTACALCLYTSAPRAPPLFS